MLPNAHYLDPSYVPDQIVARNAELDHLSSALDPNTGGFGSETARVFGPSGVGKTCLARFILREFDRERPSVRTHYVNCFPQASRFAVLADVLDGLGRAGDVQRQSTAADELVARIRRADDGLYVVVVDEADQLADSGVLYELLGMPHLTLVLVANDESRFHDAMDPRIDSRLTSTPRVCFDPYPTETVVEILSRRGDAALPGWRVTEDDLRRIAAAAAGDVRVGITALRWAAKQAADRGLTHFPEDVLVNAGENARRELREATADVLEGHERAAYLALAEVGESKIGPIEEAYQRRVDDPRSRRHLRNYLSDLEEKKLLRKKGRGSGTVYVPRESYSPTT